MKTFPKLYSLNSNKSIQEWQIIVDDNIVIKKYGQLNGAIQTTTEVIEKGKNIGKSNETTPQEQAIKQAQSEWEKKLKSGYCKTEKEARQGNIDNEFIAGGIKPMLAHKFKDHESKINYPAFVQPKMDGHRCIAIIQDGTATLWSRTRKPINSMPHIIKSLEKIFKNQSIILDGELYNHEYRDSFEKITSFIRQENPKEGCEIVKYYIYDIVNDKLSFNERLVEVSKITDIDNNIAKVETIIINDFDELMTHFSKYRKLGYEGCMVRNYNGFYKNGRSYDLQKIKEFDDEEFEIIGVESGRGKMSECAIFVCITDDNKEFNCKMEGSLENLKEILSNTNKVVGKKLTVRFQGWTNGGVPRFPIGIIIRDYE